MNAEFKYEIWDTKQDNRGYWVIRNDGICWEFSGDIKAPPKRLGKVYIPEKGVFSSWQKVRPSDYPLQIKGWLNQHSRST